jgi:hypothetical protein
MINMLSIPFPYCPFFYHDGARLVPRITALDLLRFAMVGLVLLGVVARHFVLRRGLVVVRMSGEPFGGAAWCRMSGEPLGGAALPPRRHPVAAPLPSRCRPVAATGRGCIAGSQRGVGEEEEHSSSGGMFYVL